MVKDTLLKDFYIMKSDKQFSSAASDDVLQPGDMSEMITNHSQVKLSN